MLALLASLFLSSMRASLEATRGTLIDPPSAEAAAAAVGVVVVVVEGGGGGWEGLVGCVGVIVGCAVGDVATGVACMESKNGQEREESKEREKDKYRLGGREIRMG